MKKRNKLKLNFALTLFAGITFSYGIWLLWQKLTGLIGNSWTVLGICGAILVILGFFGYFSFDKIARKFT